MPRPAPNPTQAFSKALRNLEVHHHNILAKAMLTGVGNRLSEAESMEVTVNRMARQVRDKGDMFEKDLKSQCLAMRQRWLAIKPGAVSQLQARCQQLSAGLKASGVPIALAHSAGTNPTAGLAVHDRVESAISSLESKAEAAGSAIGGTFGQFASEATALRDKPRLPVSTTAR
jgi:hypothetical protein